jgi:hypothetical protein
MEEVVKQKTVLRIIRITKWQLKYSQSLLLLALRSICGKSVVWWIENLDALFCPKYHFSCHQMKPFSTDETDSSRKNTSDCSLRYGLETG